MLSIIIPTTPERRERLNMCLDSIRNSSVESRIVIYENNKGGYINAVLKAIEDINGIVFVINDDMILDKYCIENLLKEYNDNLVYPDDEINNGTLATTYMCSADYVRKYLNPVYHHNYCDTELTDIARIQGKLKYVPSAKLEHRHWTTGAPKDSVYERNSKYLNEDRDLYFTRKANNFYL